MSYLPYGTTATLLTFVIFSTFDDSGTADRRATAFNVQSLKHQQ